MAILFSIIQLILCIVMVAVVLPKKNLPAKTWLLAFLFTLIASSIFTVGMQLYFMSENFNIDANLYFYEILGVIRNILDILGWATLLIFIISFKSTPVQAVQSVQQAKNNKTPTLETSAPKKATKGIVSTVSTAQYLYFFGFAVVIGGCIVAPITLPYILGLFSAEGAEIYLSYPTERKFFFCLLLVGLASFAYADELRFSLFKYLIGMALLGGAIATQAVKEYYSGKGVILPVGLLGIAYATIFGHIGLWVCNAITGKEERNKQVALILALVVFPLIAISSFMFMQNRSYDIPTIAKVESDPAITNRISEPQLPGLEDADDASSAISEATFAEELLHPNGLVVRRPHKFTKSVADSGFVFTETGNIRAPRFIALSVFDDAPTTNFKEQRTLHNGDLVNYSVNEIGGGSGGVEFELSAVRETGNQWITVNAIEQSEIGSPDFKVAWILMESVKLSTSD